MSGAEAIFGVIAGGAGLFSLSIQLGESAAKLRRIYHSAKDAPKVISRLAYGLETISIALNELEQQRQRSLHNGGLLLRCIAQCQESTCEIQQLVDKIETQLSRHARIGKLYATFKEPDIKDLLERLDRARGSLELAYMMCLGDEQRRFHGLHMQTLAYHTYLLQSFHQQLDTKHFESHGTAPVQRSQSKQPPHLVPMNFAMLGMSSSRNHLRKGEQKNQKRRRTLFRIRCYLPIFASRVIWDLAVIRSQWGWTMHLRTYNIVPSDASIFWYCETGNLEKIREAFANGEATALDVCCDEFNSHWTLLEIAAMRGQLETCQYLLCQTSWPDSTGVLSRALSNFTFRHSTWERQEKVYRLFFSLVEFDADTDDDSRMEWLYWCRGGQSLDVVLHNVFPGFQAQPAELRFELASRLQCLTLFDFLRCVGLQPSDPRLATLKNSNGGTTLHFVARRLFLRRHSLISRDENQALRELATFLLRHGADFCAITDDSERQWLKHAYASVTPSTTSSETSIRITPLVAMLGKRILGPVAPQRSDLEYYLSAMKTWIKLAHAAGVDLCAYGLRERRAWSSLRFHGHDKICEANSPTIDLVFGSTPDSWSFQLSYSHPCRLYSLDKIPGSYPEEHRRPSLIVWHPTQEEEIEGRWRMVAQKHIQPRIMDVRQTLAQGPVPFEYLIESTQDDTGVVALMQARASRARSVKRSHSQPPCLRRREREHYAMHQNRRRLWLAEFHLCAFDCRWRFDCLPKPLPRGGGAETGQKASVEILCDQTSWRTFDVRSCVKGARRVGSSLQETSNWRYCSFLADIGRCHDKRGPGFHDESPAASRHTGLPNCSHGCHKVFLEKLAVPKALIPFHPSRQLSV